MPQPCFIRISFSYARVPRSRPTQSEYISALTILNDSQTETVCVAWWDRNSRIGGLEMVDVASQTRICELTHSDHCHSREITQMHFSDDTLVSSSGDSVMIWKYKNEFDINHQRKETSCISQTGVHRPSRQVPIIESQLSGEFLVVLLRTGCLEILSTLTSSSVHQFDTRACWLGLSVCNNIVVLFRDSQLNFYDLQTFESIAVFSCSNRRIVSAYPYDLETLFVLTDAGVVDIVDIPSNRKIASTESLCKLAVGHFVLSRQRMIAIGNKSTDFDVFNLKKFVRSSGVTDSDPYFVEPQNQCEVAPNNLDFCGSISDSHRQETYIKYFQLPLNGNAFRFLVASKSQQDLKSCKTSKYIYKSEIVLKRLLRQRVLLSTWSSTFKSSRRSEIVEKALFPFVKLFGKHPILCFELSAFFFANFCRNWFSHKRQDVENDLEKICVDRNHTLYAHLQHLLHSTTPEVFIFEKLCVNLLTELIPTPAWLRMLDCIAIWFHNNHRQNFDDRFFLRIIVEYLVSQKIRIFDINTKEELYAWSQTEHEITPEQIQLLFTSIAQHRRGNVFVLPENVVQYPDLPN